MGSSPLFFKNPHHILGNIKILLYLYNMKKLLLVLGLAATSAIGFGQGCEHDSDDNGVIGMPDLLSFLGYYGAEVECNNIPNFYNSPNYYNTIYGNNGLTPTPEPDSIYTYNTIALHKGSTTNLKPNTCINVNAIIMTGTSNVNSNYGATINCPDCSEPSKIYVHTPVLGNNTFPEWNVGPNNGWSLLNIEIINEPCGSN